MLALKSILNAAKASLSSSEQRPATSSHVTRLPPVKLSLPTPRGAGKGFFICSSPLPLILMFSTKSKTPFLSPGVLQLVFPCLSIGCSLFWSCLPEFYQLPELIATTPVRYPFGVDVGGSERMSFILISQK